MKILVTGAAGFIGSHLCEKLLESPSNHVIGIDNFHDYYSRSLKENNLRLLLPNRRFDFKEMSILDFKSLGRIQDVDIVYHYAAIAGVRHSIKNPLPYFQINYQGTANVLEAFKNVKKFVFASSSSVYGSPPLEDLPVSESYPLKANSPYPLSKIHAEELCLHYQETYSLPMAILRFYTVYGSRQRPDEMFTKFILRILNDQEIEVYGNGEQTRDFTHVSDIVRGSILAQERGQGIYNLGSSRRISVNSALAVISKVLGNAAPVLKYVPARKEEATHTHADITKASRGLGYTPSVSLEEGVRDCADWCKSIIGFV